MIFKKTSIKFLAALFLVATFTVALASCNLFHEHSFGEWVVTKEATCTDTGVKTKTCECGETQTEALTIIPHIWVDATCEKAKTCSACQATEGEALGHVWVDATCEKAKTCSVCETTDGEELDVFIWLKNYIMTNGDYASGEYEIILHSDYITGCTEVVISYDKSYPDEICLYYFYSRGTYYNLISIYVDCILSGIYEWAFIDSDENYMLGTIKSSIFTDNTESLSYTSSTLPTASLKQSAAELSASSLRFCLSLFNGSFSEYGLGASDLGFVNFD